MTLACSEGYNILPGNTYFLSKSNYVVMVSQIIGPTPVDQTLGIRNQIYVYSTNKNYRVVRNAYRHHSKIHPDTCTLADK